MLQQLYGALPVALQHFGATVRGAQYYRWRYGGVFPEYLNFLKGTEFQPAPQLIERQKEELKKLLPFAAAHVAHYRRHGVSGFTTKEQLRENPREFLADTFPLRALLPRYTSGTTGTPLTIYQSREAVQKMWAFVELHRNTAGVHKRDRRGQFTGQMIVPPGQATARKIFWRHDLANRALLLSSVHLLPENLPYYAEALERFRPVYLCGYPSAIYVLAKYYGEAGRPAPKLAAVLTSAETLLDYQRPVIEQTFATRVFDQYGQTEMQSFWYECEAGAMHAHPLAGVTEILRADGTAAPPGEIGEVVLTGLVNYAMPLIRYRVGDTASFAGRPCTCGRAMPVIEKIGGRCDDVVFTPERGYLGRLDPVLKGVPHIVESQIEQIALDRLIVHYVPAAHFGAEDLRALERNLRARVGWQIYLEFACTDRIPRSPKGKFQFVVSRLDRPVPRSFGSSRVCV